MTATRSSTTLPGRLHVRTRDWPALVSVAAGMGAVVWAANLLVRRIAGLSAPPYDLAFFQQVVWNVGANGQWISSFSGGSFLGVHFSPILVIPAVLERLLWADARVLSLSHAVTIGALVPAAFLLIRATLKPSRAAGPLAAGLAITIPWWGSMQEVIRSDFHPEAAGVVLALFAGWAGLTGRPRVMWGLAALALATREDVAYGVAIVGLLVAVRGRGRMRQHGRAMIAVALAWAVIVFGILMPWIRQGAVGDTDGYYAWLGGGLNVLSAPFTMTEAVAAALTRSGSWFVVGGMVISLVGLPLLRPRWALLTLPPLAALLLSANSFQAGIRLQYPLILVVPLLVAAALGGRRAIAAANRLRRRRRGHRPERALGARFPRRHARRLSPLLPLLLALPAVAGAWVQGSLPPFDLGDPSFLARPPAIDRLRLVAAAVPSSARLLVDEGLVAPLADRSSIGRLAGSTPAPDAYVLIDRLAWSPTWRLERRQAQLVDRLERSADRPILADDGRFVLWGPQTVAGSP